MGLIRIIGIALIIYLIIRLITRFILPLAARYFMRKASETLQEQVKTRQSGQKIYEEGEVTIRKTQQKSSESKASDSGDYVDFEEV